MEQVRNPLDTDAAAQTYDIAHGPHIGMRSRIPHAAACSGASNNHCRPCATPLPFPTWRSLTQPQRESAEIGVLLSFEEPSAGMRSEAAEAGLYESPWGRHPRIQLRTIRELLDGKGIDYPHVTGANVTHRRPQRARPAGPEAMELFGPAAEEPADNGDPN